MTAIATVITPEAVQSACQEASIQARVRSNSKIGKALQAQGFRKDYTGSLCMWNPSGFPTQSISILEAGAEAYAQVLKDQLGLDRVYAGSRLD